MANAVYVKTVGQGLEPEQKAVSVVNVDGKEVTVAWWPSLIEQWGKAGTKAYIEAEALASLGFLVDARPKIELFVEGDNWAQQWINEHPDPAPVEPVADPFL